MSTRPLVIDAHHYFWDSTRHHDDWMLGARVDPIHKSFTPDDLRPLLAPAGVDYTVLVQTAPSMAETRELLQIAEKTEFVTGVVGWVDLADPAVDEALAELGARPDGKWLVGIRHPVQDEQDAEWLLRLDVQRGLTAVADAGLAYDFLVRPRELPATLATARAFPRMRFVIDHLGKPPVASDQLDTWAGLLEPFRGLLNVSCKLSGMLTEAGWTGWAPPLLRPYVSTALDIFGVERLMYGSDWPVSLLRGQYGVVKQALEEALPPLPQWAWQKVFGGNAINVYRLDPELLRAKEA